MPPTDVHSTAAEHEHNHGLHERAVFDRSAQRRNGEEIQADKDNEDVHARHDVARPCVILRRIGRECTVVPEQASYRNKIERREDEPEIPICHRCIGACDHRLHHRLIHDTADTRADETADDAVEKRVAHVHGFLVGGRDESDVTVILWMRGHLADGEDGNAENEYPHVRREREAKKAERANDHA